MGTPTESESRLACDLNALDPAQRERRLILSTDLSRACQGFRELPDGFAFRFPHDAFLRQKVQEWVTYERVCCPFLTFTLEEDRDSGSVWLHATGRTGVKSFLRTGLGLVKR